MITWIKSVKAWEWVLSLGIICSLGAFILWPPFKGSGMNFFSKFHSLGYFLCAVAFLMNNPKSRVTRALGILTLNMTMDEWLFNPEKLDLNEFVTVGCILIIILFNKAITYFIEWLIDVITHMSTKKKFIYTAFILLFCFFGKSVYEITLNLFW